ncbi:hypothetical protein BDK88_3688 [Natrinema hispanicum]|uniref:Uncharacterized protein n=1 Tax=Natrinema hispanicum TaxID=392421 RepID=A0A482Y503_9EURY|nr:hypothetical protein [Natrinema hispanicum]RZV06663.1 hypothetical protein BDK88_3688 [Natrinema hispanicum]
MSDKKPNNPLSPYFPSETPSLSGNVPKWIAIGVVLWGVFWAIYMLLDLLFGSVPSPF